MNINKYFGIEGAQMSAGETVIIDVFRAATVEAYLLGKGATKILPVSTKEEAFKLKKAHPSWVLVGEERGIKISGFDFGNSPYEISKTTNLKGKTIIHRSSTGTQGIVNATGASEIIFGSFCTCSAIVKHIKKQSVREVSIVSMDGEGSEDDQFANYLISMLTNTSTQNMSKIIAFTRHLPNAWKHLDPNNKDFPEEDFYLCMDLDTFNFAPVLHNGFILKK